jgi:hypothetical protein
MAFLLTQKERVACPGSVQLNLFLSEFLVFLDIYGCGNILKKMNLAAIFQCSNQYKAATEVCKRFREIYPAVPFLIINDGGDPVMGSVSPLFHAEYAPCSKTSCCDEDLKFSDPYLATSYVERLFAGMPEEEGFVLLLENDTWVCGQVPLTDLKYDMSGGRSGLVLCSELRDVVRKYRPDLAKKNKLVFANSGGAFLKSFFINAMRTPNDIRWKRRVGDLFRVKTPITSGELLSCLTYMAGGTVGPYPGYYEPTFLRYVIRKKIGYNGGIRIIGKEKSLFEQKH